MTDAKLTSKERVKTALRRQEPDRVPVFVTLTAGLARRMARQLGLSDRRASSYLENRLSHHAMLTALGNDAVGVGYCAPSTAPTVQLADGTFRDEWGFIYQEVVNQFGANRDIVGRPLAGIRSARELARYKFPDPDAPGRFDLAHEMMQTYGRDYATIGAVECTVFEYAWNLVGFEKFLMDLANGADYAEPLLDEVMNYNVEVGKRLIRMGVDVILTGDDFGTQQGLLISPALWRRYFKERFRRVFAAFKKENPDVIIAYHSCGSARRIVPELIEIGLESLNPVQPRAAGMDPAELKAAYGDRLSFSGGVDIQEVMPFGTVADVKEEVRLRIRQLGPGGGYLLGPAHDLQPEVPVENVLALFDAVREYGTYPLS